MQISRRLVSRAHLSQNGIVNRLIIATLFAVPLSIFAQTPPPSIPPAAGAFNASPAVVEKKIDPEKEKLIRNLLARTKEAEMTQERIFQGMAGLKQMMPRVPEKYWAQYRQLISVDELRNRLVYVYDKHFTSDDLKALLQFYDSPIGKKLSENTLPILRESMEIAQQMSKRAGEAVAQDFRAEQLLQQPRAAGSLGGPLPAPGNPLAPAPLASSPTPTPR
jgi:uncharacterized protein